MSPDQFREGLHVSLGGALGEVALFGGAILSTHSEAVSVGAKRIVRSYSGTAPG